MKASSPPFLKLRPTTPSLNNKYEGSLNGDHVTRAKSTIPALTRFTRSLSEAPLPQGWLEYTHPEGNIYYHNPKNHVVSITDPRRNGATDILNNALERVQDQLRDSAPEGVEIYLSVPYDSWPAAGGVVEYYLVDYDHRSIFWIDDVDISTDLAGSASFIDQFESMRHLRSGLEPEFWMHVEYYPCHQSTYDHYAEKELIAILRHGCVDDMTAPGSVCPYGVDECLRYLKLLERAHGDDESNDSLSYRRSWTARLWASICRSRHINKYGLPYPRVDRLQGLDSYLMRQTHRSVVMAVGEAFCLGTSRKAFARLTELWNGRIVYQRHWQPFLEQQRSEWRWTAFGGLYLLIMNAVQSISGTSIIFVVSSASFTCSAVMMSALMLQAHAADRLRTASDISMYIAMTESFKHGLRPLSIAFTLPKALLGYGMLISAGNTVRHFAEHLQNDSAQLLYTSTAAIVPLLMSLVVYFAYGPVTA